MYDKQVIILLLGQSARCWIAFLRLRSIKIYEICINSRRSWFLLSLALSLSFSLFYYISSHFFSWVREFIIEKYIFYKNALYVQRSLEPSVWNWLAIDWILRESREGENKICRDNDKASSSSWLALCSAIERVNESRHNELDVQCLQNVIW